MSIITDEEMIIDIQRVACLLNTNQLSLDEYIDNGGKYNADIIVVSIIAIGVPLIKLIELLCEFGGGL